MKKQPWAVGDSFLIPLLDGSHLLAQVLAYEPQAMNSASCALFDQRIGGAAPPDPDIGKLISLVMVTRDLLDSGKWKVVGRHPVSVSPGKFPYESLRSVGFVGAKIIGSKSINDFANAFYSLDCWDKFFDPAYMDKLLISPSIKPVILRYKRDLESC